MSNHGPGTRPSGLAVPLWFSPLRWQAIYREFYAYTLWFIWILALAVVIDWKYNVNLTSRINMDANAFFLEDLTTCSRWSELTFGIAVPHYVTFNYNCLDGFYGFLKVCSCIRVGHWAAREPLQLPSCLDESSREAMEMLARRYPDSGPKLKANSSCGQDE